MSYSFKNEKNSRINKNFKYKGIKYHHKQLQQDKSLYLENANKLSIRCAKRLCDITGLPAKYKCPRTGLYYHDLLVYDFIRNMKMETVKNYINLRFFGKNIYSFQKDF